MPIRETWRTIRGRSSRERWACTARQVAMAGAIVGTLYAVALGVRTAFRALGHRGIVDAGSIATVENATGIGATAAFVLSCAVLASILVVSFLVAWLRRRHERRGDPLVPAPAGRGMPPA